MVALSGPKAITEFTTGADGKFSFSGLHFGEYELTVTKSGFKKNIYTVNITEGASSVTLSCSLSNPNALYGGSEDDWIGKSSMAIASDGTLWIAAATKSSNDDLASADYHSDFDGWLLHINPSKLGKDSILLSKCFGGTNMDLITDIKIAENGSLWLLGCSSSTDGDLSGVTTKGALDAWLMNVDASGKILSNACFGGSENDFEDWSSLCLASDGTLWLGGITKSADKDLQGKGYHGEDDACLFHIASDGERILSVKCFGGTADEEVCGIAEKSDKSIFFAINTFSSDEDLKSAGNHGLQDACLFRIASDGETILSKKCFGGSQDDSAYAFKVAKDDSLWLAGCSHSSDGDLSENKGNSDGWLFNVASDGITLLSSKTFGGSQMTDLLPLLLWMTALYG